MTMAYSWFRVYTGTVNDKKWPRIARDAGQPVGCVVSVWLALLESASSNIDRGAVDDFCPEDIDALYGYDDGTTESIVHAMRDRGLISPENRLTAWDKRQNIPAEDAPEDRRAYKREWARRKREESRMADSPASGQPVDSCGHDVDTSGQPVDSCGHHREKIREEKIREDNINTLPPTPSGGSGNVPSSPERPVIDFSHSNGLYQGFKYVWNIWPIQQAEEDAWKEYCIQAHRKVLPDSYVLADIIDNLKQHDARWQEGFIPLMSSWLKGQRWKDKPVAAPQPRERAPASRIDEVNAQAARMSALFENGGGEIGTD